MRIRLALLLALTAAVLAAPVVAEAASPFEPFRQLFREPVKTIKRVMRTPSGSKAKAPAAVTPAKTPPPADKAPADDKTAAAATEPQTGAVPLPRLRPATAPDTDRFASMSFAPVSELKVASAPAAAILPPAKTDATPAEAAPAPDEVSPADRAAIPPDRRPGDLDVVMPRPRPAHVAMAAPDPAPTRTKPAGTQLASLPPGGFDTPSACKRSLASLGIESAPLAPIHEGACGIAQPTAVASLDNGAVELSTKAIVNCAVAGAMAAWLDEEVQPAAKRLLGGRVTGLRIAASYACRGRNNIAGAKLSEHAFGNAVDISALKVGDRWIEVGKTSGADQRFISEIRQEACGPFTTVLGPGVAYHDTHLHFDLARRNKKGRSKGLYCK